MKRILLGLVLGALIFSAAIGAKVVTVTNPMSGDLDGGSHTIGNVSNYFTTAGSVLGGDSLSTHVVTLSTSQVVQAPYAVILAGTDDPSAVAPEGNNWSPPSLYLRRLGDGTGQLWFKAGPNPLDWTRLS